MSDDDLMVFFSLGLSFSPDEAARLSRLFRMACVLLGLAGGAGLAIAALKDLNKIGHPGHAAPSRSMSLAMLLAGLGVGTVAVGGFCTTVKMRVESYLARFANAHDAIRGLDPGKVKDFAADCRKMLALGDRIEDMYRIEQQNARFSSDLVA